MRHSILAIALFVLLVLFSGIALAHGGRYRGPAGEVPPPTRDPREPQPPGSDPGRFGDPVPKMPAPPEVVPVPPGPKADPPGRWSPPRPMSFDRWLFWWHMEKDSMLAERFPPRELTPEEEGVVDEFILPALRKALENRDIHPDIRAGALIAIARAGPGTEREVERMLEYANALDEDLIVRESGILGLGLLGETSEQVTGALRAIADDNEKRRVRERCFALVALGLLRDSGEATWQCCLRRLDGRESTPDAQVCALLSIGLIGDPNRAPALIEMFRTGRHKENELSPLVRAWIMDALGRIGNPAALKPALSALSEEKNLNVKRSAAIAIGRLLPHATKAERDLAYRRLEALPRIEDRTARNLLLLGLARASASLEISWPETSSCLLLHQRVIGSLFESPDGGFLALALAIGCESDDPGAFSRRHLGNLFRAGISLEGIRWGEEPDLAAAHALALGLLGDDREETVDLLIETLGNPGHPNRLRGAAAMALALLGDPRGATPVTKALLKRESRDARIDLVLAAGILPTPGTTEAILHTFMDHKCSQFVLGSCAISVGRMRDFKALPRLIDILEPEAVNGAYTDLTRALVGVALGLLGNRREGDPLSRISQGFPWRASVPALDELLTIL